MKAKDGLKRHYNKENNAALKWTEEKVMDVLDELSEHIKKNPTNYMLGKALIDVGLYKEWYSYIADRYKDNYEVISRMTQIQAEYEYKIINSTMSGDIKSAAMAIFILKNVSGYKDKTETEIITTEKPLPISFDEDVQIIDEKDIKSLGLKKEEE